MPISYIDTSVNQNTVTYHGDADIQGNMLDLDGNGDYCVVDANGDITRIYNADKWSIEIKFTPTDVSSGIRHLLSIGNDASNRVFNIYQNNDDLVFRFSTDGTTWAFDTTSSSVLTGGTEHTLTMEWDGRHMLAYLDGSQVKRWVNSTKLNTLNWNWNVGRLNGEADTTNFKGKIRSRFTERDNPQVVGLFMAR